MPSTMNEFLNKALNEGKAKRKSRISKDFKELDALLKKIQIKVKGKLDFNWESDEQEILRKRLQSINDQLTAWGMGAKTSPTAGR